MSTKDRRRKKLAIPDEQFFQSCALVFGSPHDYEQRTSGPFYYESKNPKTNPKFRWGFGFWLEETPEGKLWLRLVTEAGEAKGRAAQLYRRYAKWHRDQKHGHTGERAGGSGGDDTSHE